MEQDINNEKTEQPLKTQKKGYLNRRDILKGLATLPILGVFFQKLIRKYHWIHTRKNKF